MSEDKRKQVVKELKHDNNFARVGRKTGVSHATVRVIAQKEGFKAGPQGAGPRISEEKRTQILEALKHARSYSAAALEVGSVSHVTVAKIAKEAEDKNLLSKIASPTRESMARRQAARWRKSFGHSVNHN